MGFVKAGFSFIYANLCLLPHKKTGHIDSHEKQALNAVQYLIPVCKILQNFTEKMQENSLFCALFFKSLKYQKRLLFSFDCV